MPKTFKRLPSFEGVAAGQTATLRCPIGSTYHAIYIPFRGLTLAQMRGIRVIANGKAIRDYDSGTVLNVMNMHDGLENANDAKVLIINFERYGLEGRNARELTALGTGHPEDRTPITTLSVEIDIDEGAEGPHLSAKALRSPATPLNVFEKVRRFSYNAPGAGDYEISDLPRGDLISSVFFRSKDVISLKLERNSYVEFERTDGENRLIQRNGIRKPQPGQTVYDPLEFGNGTETIATAGANDLRFILNMAGEGPLPVVVRYIGALDG